MKGLKMAGLALFAAAAVTTSWAADLKIGFVNSEKIFSQYEETKVAQEKFNKEVAKWEQKASKNMKEIQELKTQLEKQSLLLSDERKKELQDSLRQKIMAHEKFVQEKFGQRGEALVKNEELTKPIIGKINKIIEKIAKDENYDFILDTRAGGLVYGKDTYDLTDRVMKLLTKEK